MKHLLYYITATLESSYALADICSFLSLKILTYLYLCVYFLSTCIFVNYMDTWCSPGQLRGSIPELEL